MRLESGTIGHPVVDPDLFAPKILKKWRHLDETPDTPLPTGGTGKLVVKEPGR